MDVQEPICPFDVSAYTGTPDAEPCAQSLPVALPELIAQLDALYDTGREAEAGPFLENWLAEARRLGDWRAELSLLSELLGHYRRSKEEAKAVTAVRDALSLIREHRMGSTVSGATVMLNAATTLKCFGRAGESLPLFEQVSRVYGDNLDPADYRFGGLYNNMALSYQDLGRFELAEQCFKHALAAIARCPEPDNELAVTWCNLAELYHAQDPLDERVGESLEQAWSHLNAPNLRRDGYHAFTASKCAPCFSYLGYFLYARELKERAASIYEGA